MCPPKMKVLFMKGQIWEEYVDRKVLKEALRKKRKNSPNIVGRRRRNYKIFLVKLDHRRIF